VVALAPMSKTDFPRKGNHEMKKMLFAVSALAALALLAPSAGFAQANNQLGLYTDQAATPASANTTQPAFAPFDVYLILTQPVNENFAGGGTSVPVTNIGGFELSLTVPANLTTLSFVTATPSARVGAAPDYIYGFGSPLPVVGNLVVLGTFSFMAMDSAIANAFMGPSSVPGIPGKMAFIDSDDANAMVACYPSTGAFANPVLSVSGNDAVPNVTESWGGVKSLFR